jgi:NTE family protein
MNDTDSTSGTVKAGRPSRLGLVLPGAGARSAYQIGVLKAISHLLGKEAHCPFPVIVGSSAGAILGTVLATHAGRFRLGTCTLERVWRNLSVDEVVRDDVGSMLRSGLRFLLALVSAGWLVEPPRSMLDSAPLRALLEKHVNLARVRHALERGWLHAIGINASAYQSARSICFYETLAEVVPWQRGWRSGEPASLSLDHVMASAAVPFLFPPVMIDGEYYGDGAMRQVAPLSPAIHLGADRLLVITVREAHGLPAPSGVVRGPPAMGQVFGFMLDTLFLDGLSSDLDRVQRDNQLVAAAGEEVTGLRQVATLVVSPRDDLGEIALKHRDVLPGTLKALLRSMGAVDHGGRQLLSYLLFEAPYIRELIAVGYRDGLEKSAEIKAFLAGAAD